MYMYILFTIDNAAGPCKYVLDRPFTDVLVIEIVFAVVSYVYPRDFYFDASDAMPVLRSWLLRCQV